MNKVNHHIPLSHLKPGEKARVTCIEQGCGLCHRLSALGVLPDADVCMVREAPFGDPITISVYDQEISLRRLDAQSIEVCTNA